MIKILWRMLFYLAIISFLFILGCAMTQQTVPTPTEAKPEAATPPAPQTAPEVVSESPSALSPAPLPQAKIEPPPPAKELPPQEPKTIRVAEASLDPIATGTVLLNPSVPQDAKTIQSRLAELDLYKGEIDGRWGKGSRTALRKFKEKRFLSNPDKWDKEAQIALFTKTSQAKKPAAEAGQDAIASGAVLLNPSVPQDAKTIQSRLAELGLYKGEIDGRWGKGSRTALKTFKEKNSLKNPNQWDRETQILLFK